jgi:hypothetical protein
MFGGHCLKTWSSTQEVIALSSGEAEYYALVKAVSQGIGIRNLLQDLGIVVDIEVNMDASAAKAIASRKGCGKVRHIDVATLWVQEKVANKEVKLVKVAGHENLADILTKHEHWIVCFLVSELCKSQVATPSCPRSKRYNLSCLLVCFPTVTSPFVTGQVLCNCVSTCFGHVCFVHWSS